MDDASNPIDEANALFQSISFMITNMTMTGQQVSK